jgi:IS30 family transposase
VPDNAPPTRNSKEKLKGLVRQSRPKDIELSICNQRDLDKAAYGLIA